MDMRFSFLGGRSVIEHLQFRKEILADSKPEDRPDILSLFKQAKDEAGYVPDIPVRISAGAKTPFTIGLFTSSLCLILPDQNYPESELRLIFRHELIHVLRHDSQLKFLIRLVTCVCWFLPMIYSAMKRCSQEAELAADQLAADGMTSQEKELYASAVLQGTDCGRGFTACFSADDRSSEYRKENIERPQTGKSGAVLLVCVMFILLLTAGAVSFGCNHSSVQETLFSQFGDQPLMTAVYRDDYTDFSRPSRNLKCANPEQFKEYISGLTICEGCIDREMMTDKAALILHFGEDQSEYAVAVYNHMIGIVKSSEPEYDRLFWLDRKTDWNQLLSFFEKQHDCLSSGKQRSYCIHF